MEESYERNKQQEETANMLYLEKYDGYMADVPNIEFVRCDNKLFAYDELTSASMTVGHNTITITGGQGNFPLAYIDTDST